MVSGTEKFGYTPFYKQIPSTDFLPDNDVAFYTIAPEAVNYITLAVGEFIIFSTTDIHQPEVFVNAPMDVRKIVVKVQAG
jgi:YhcH/YjgK/YiaL family protein